MLSSYSINAPSSSIGGALTTRKPSQGGVITSRFRTSEKNENASCAGNGTR